MSSRNPSSACAAGGGSGVAQKSRRRSSKGACIPLIAAHKETRHSVRDRASQRGPKASKAPHSHHVRVGEEEHDLLVVGAQPAVQLLEVLPEGQVVVAPHQRDLKDLAAARVRGQARERLLAAAADADQQQVALRQPRRPADAGQVLQGVLEEHLRARGVGSRWVRHEEERERERKREARSEG